MNSMNNNKIKQNNNSYIDDEENSSCTPSPPEVSTTQKYMNSLLKPIKPGLDGMDDRIKPVTPTCHSILQRRSLPERSQPLMKVGENRYKNPPPPPPLNIKNRLGSTTEMQEDDNVFRSQAEEIARELHIVRKISNLAPVKSEAGFDSYVTCRVNDRFVYDYEEEDHELQNGILEHSNGNGDPHGEFREPEEEAMYNIGEKFKIARPILARTTSVGRLVNNFESIEETRSLAGDVRPRSPPITNSQRRFGTLTRQRTHLGLGSDYSAITREYDENDYYQYTNNIEENNGNNGHHHGMDDENVGWGATRHRTGPTTGKFRGVTNIWGAKSFVPPNQPKPPLPPLPACLSSKSTNYLQHSVRYLFINFIKECVFYSKLTASLITLIGGMMTVTRG